MRLPVIKYRAIWFLLSGMLVLASIGSIATYGLKFGIDFTGGSLLEVAFSGERPSVEDVTAAVVEFGHAESVVQTAGDESMLIRTKGMDETEHLTLVGDLQKKWPDLSEQRFESIGPTVGDELRRKAAWSLGLVLLAITLYVAYAFRKVSRPVSSWKYALITLMTAILHDVVLPLGIFAL